MHDKKCDIFLTKIRKFVEKNVTLFYYISNMPLCGIKETDLAISGLDEWRKKYVPDREERGFG